MLYSEMGVRSYINGQILYRINYDQCTCKNLIMARGDEFLDRQRMDLENKILDLEQEKRREETAFFRDFKFLEQGAALCQNRGAGRKTKTGLVPEYGGDNMNRCNPKRCEQTDPCTLILCTVDGK